MKINEKKTLRKIFFVFVVLCYIASAAFGYYRIYIQHGYKVYYQESDFPNTFDLNTY